MVRLLSVVCISVAFIGHAVAEGVYQKTRDQKTSVWNNEPKPGDEATWSGGRDDEGYAKGFGTLTWYSPPNRAGGRASDTSNERPVVFARYFGNMVRGKFEGPVNVHAKNETHYSVFVDGKRMTRWTRGAAPQRAWATHRELAAKEPKKELEAPAEGPKTANAERPNPHIEQPTAPAQKEPEAPAEGPQTANAQRPPPNIQRSTAEEKAETEAPRTVAKVQTTPTPPPPPKSKPPQKTKAPAAASLPSPDMPPLDDTKAQKSTETDNSLQMLAGPPTSLRRTPPPPEPETSQVPAQPTLTSEEVVDVAESAARSHGVNPAEFERGEAKFSAQDETWTLPYRRGGADAFSVTIDDKTKGTVFVPAKQ